MNDKTDETTAPKEVNWLLTLICSLLAGTLAIDRFLMGHIELGVLKLVTAGGLGIWWLIDLLLIANKYEFKGVKWK